MFRLRTWLVLWGVIAGINTGVVRGQERVGGGANRDAVFEVASIRPHANADDPQQTNLLSGGRYEGRNASVRKLIRLATGAEDRQIVGVPDWADSARYDIDAKVADTGRLQPQVFQRALLDLLAGRFGFRFHREAQQRRVFWLVADKRGARLKPNGDNAEPTMTVNGTARKVLVATGISMQELAGLLSRQAQRPVQDHTGLSGRYDVRLEWDETQAADSALPSLFGALQEQLGLELSPAKDTVEVVVVDQIQRPTPN